jgi:hypothetical protein
MLPCAGLASLGCPRPCSPHQLRGMLVHVLGVAVHCEDGQQERACRHGQPQQHPQAGYLWWKMCGLRLWGNASLGRLKSSRSAAKL